MNTGPTTDEGGADPAATGGTFRSVRRGVSRLVGAWMTVVRAFSWLFARVVVSVVFVVAIVPYALVMRLVNFDPLDRDTEPSAESYWSATEATNASLAEFRRLY
jgi:hypothetical protein